MQSRALVILIAVVAAVLLIRASVFTVNEGQMAVKLIGGKIIDSDYAPGLHVRIPLVNQVARFDKRIITQLYRQERFLTQEQEQLLVDFYIKWRIDDLRQFYEATDASQEIANERANDRLGEIVKDSVKSIVTKHTLPEVVAAERSEFTDAIMRTTRGAAEKMGVSIVDVRITKIELPQQVQDSVYERMRASFKAQAAKLRAEGYENSERTKADANKQRTEILSNAQKQAAEIRGQGDATASETYAKSFSKNAEFYSFYRSLQSYRESVGTPSDLLVIAPDSAYFKYFGKSTAQAPTR